MAFYRTAVMDLNKPPSLLPRSLPCDRLTGQQVKLRIFRDLLFPRGPNVAASRATGAQRRSTTEPRGDQRGFSPSHLSPDSFLLLLWGLARNAEALGGGRWGGRRGSLRVPGVYLVGVTSHPVTAQAGALRKRLAARLWQVWLWDLHRLGGGDSRTRRCYCCYSLQQWRSPPRTNSGDMSLYPHPEERSHRSEP
ncbi:unnamed protein product [Arctogadus glacialis]